MFIPHKPWYFEAYEDYYDKYGDLIGFKIDT